MKGITQVLTTDSIVRRLVLSVMVCGAVVAGYTPSTAHAGGAYIYEMANPSDIGYAGAGLAARAGDAATVFTNPAGMTGFDKSEFVAGAVLLYLNAEFNPDENNTVVGSDGQTNEFVPAGNFAYVRPINDKLKLGISAQNYFGLSLDWSGQWVGRFNSVKTTIVAPQVQPTAAYKVNDWLSVGAGAGLTLGYLYDKARIDTLDPNRPDGKLRVSDSDFAVQGNFGIMIEPSERTRFGLRYLTETDLDFEDGVHVSGVGPGFNFDPNSDITTPANGLDLGVKMPQTVMAGAYHQLNDKWALLGSVGWDEWSAFGKINVRVEGTDLVTEVDAGFRDVWHFGMGTEFQYSPKLMLTGGVSYDTSMMTDATRPIMIPLGAMYRYGVGFQYRRSDAKTFGGGFTFLYEGKLPVKPGSGGLDGQVSGAYDSNTSLSWLSFYVKWR
jgi:long-chain fatty acid transport protein